MPKSTIHEFKLSFPAITEGPKRSLVGFIVSSAILGLLFVHLILVVGHHPRTAAQETRIE